MSTARQEIVQRQKGNITPKLHLLEGHVVSAMRHYGVGRMLAEQGGESIHAEFNTLARELKHTSEDLARLRMIVKQHCQYVATRARENSKSSTAEAPKVICSKFYL